MTTFFQAISRFLPYEQISIETHLSPEATQKKLAEHIEPGSLLARHSNTDKAYRGKLGKNRFEIVRVISYRNSFLPVITGKIDTDLGKTLLNITMKPHILVIVFMGIWFSSLISFSSFSIFALFLSYFDPSSVDVEGSPWVIFLGIGFMFVFGYALVMFGFGLEAKKAKQFFQDLFKMGGKN